MQQLSVSTSSCFEIKKLVLRCKSFSLGVAQEIKTKFGKCDFRKSPAFLILIGGRFKIIAAASSRQLRMAVSPGRTYPVQVYTRSIDLVLAPIASRVSFKIGIRSRCACNLMSVAVSFKHNPRF